MAVSAAAVADAPAPAAPPALPYRVGHGFDLHRLAEGYKLVIGGIEIPHTKGCEAHSDGEAAAACTEPMALPVPTQPAVNFRRPLELVSNALAWGRTLRHI